MLKHENIKSLFMPSGQNKNNVPRMRKLKKRTSL
tara:strand:+ start:36 stop:137 length:102 start_codon:yes stop_codon:yes gene_type:complete